MRRLIPALLLTACAHRAAPDVRAPLRAWAEAARRDDPHAAWLLLSAAERKRVPEAQFRATWVASRAERDERAAALAAAPLEVAMVADVKVGDRTTRLLREPDGWRLVAPKWTVLGAATPEDALARFVRALETRDLDAVLSLLSEPLRNAVESELGDRLARLRGVLGKPIPVDGTRARVQYDARYHVDLVQENGQWSVADFN
jgi:hypothetical protein